MKDILNQAISDMAEKFDSLGFVPTTLVPNEEYNKCFKEWFATEISQILEVADKIGNSQEKPHRQAKYKVGDKVYIIEREKCFGFYKENRERLIKPVTIKSVYEGVNIVSYCLKENKRRYSEEFIYCDYSEALEVLRGKEE